MSLENIVNNITSDKNTAHDDNFITTEFLHLFTFQTPTFI